MGNSDTMRRQVMGLCEGLMKSKEGLIKKVITIILGNSDWQINDMLHRASISYLPNGDELVMFDGEAIIRFYGLKTVLIDEDEQFKIKAELDYKVLYEK